MLEPLLQLCVNVPNVNDPEPTLADNVGNMNINGM